MATKKNNNNSNSDVQQLSTIIETKNCTLCAHQEVCKYQSKFQAFIKDMNEKETTLSDLKNFKIILKCDKFLETWRYNTITINDNWAKGISNLNQPAIYQPSITQPIFKDDSVTITCSELTDAIK